MAVYQWWKLLVRMRDHEDYKDGSVLIPLHELLADDVGHARRMPAVLRYLDSRHLDVVGFRVDHQHFRIRRVIFGRPHVGLSNRFSVIFFRACREELLHLFFPAGQVQVLPAG